jgi:hypothetical protein
MPNASGKNSMTCETYMKQENRYGREMVGYSAGFEPALPAISNLNLNLTMIIRANFYAEVIKVVLFSDSELLESLK